MFKLTEIACEIVIPLRPLFLICAVVQAHGGYVLMVCLARGLLALFAAVALLNTKLALFEKLAEAPEVGGGFGDCPLGFVAVILCVAAAFIPTCF